VSIFREALKRINKSVATFMGSIDLLVFLLKYCFFTAGFSFAAFVK